MEDFIADIYQYSFVISNLKEFIFLLNSGHVSQARALYNETAIELEKLLIMIAASDPAKATSIQDIAVEAKDCYEDYSRCKGLIEGRLIPVLYKCISNFNRIEVTEGKYTLRSSNTGFLTVKDNETGLYLHDTNDPMNEAYQIVNTVYKPEMEGFLLLGSGLGYEAYQLYHQSNGAIRICLYEEDETILNYARLYGVLSLIPDENMEIIHIPDKTRLAEHFINDVNSHNVYGYHIASFKKQIYDGICDNELNRIIINQEYSLESAHLSVINLWKNKKLKRTTFSEAAKKYCFNEYVIISAGPSLDYNLDFLKDSMGNKGLIAVNTVLRRLIKEGIIPDIIAAADPSLSLANHICGIENSTKDIALIADWILSWKYSYLYKGDICFVRTNASATLTEDLLSNEPVWDISGTVACLGIEAAVRLGARKIYLVGQDLAYPSGQRYAMGMPHGEVPDAKWDMHVPSVDGSMVDTCEAFEWFRKSIEYQIAKYDYIAFENMSKHGAYIKGTANHIHPADYLI